MNMSTATEDSSRATTIACSPRPRIFLRLQDAAEVRPCGTSQISLRQVNAEMMTLQAPEGEHLFNFGRIFKPNEGESQIFEEVGRPVVQQLIQGQIPLLIMQGDMTRIGEHNTMVGNCLQDLFKVLPSKLAPPCVLQWNGQDGFELCNPRAFAEHRVLEPLVDARCMTPNKEMWERSSVFVSYLQVYNNCVYDLLANEKDQFKPLLIRECSRQSVISFHPSDSKHLEIRSADEGINLLLLGEQTRRRLNVKLNAQEQRCHTIFTISLLRVELLQNYDEDSIHWSHLSVVHLAGNNPGNSRPDNSLQTLRECLIHLRRGEKYSKQRQSKLTQLLYRQLQQPNGVNLLIFLSPMDHLYEEYLELLEVARRMDAKPKHPHVADSPQDFDCKKLKLLLTRGRKHQQSMKQITQRLRHVFMSVDNSMSQLRTDNSALISSQNSQQKQAKDMETKLKSHVDFNNQLLLQLNQARRGAEELKTMLSEKDKACSIQQQTIILAKDRISRMRRSYESREQFLVSMQNSKVTELRVQLNLKEEELKKLRRSKSRDELLDIDGISVAENPNSVSAGTNVERTNALVAKAIKSSSRKSSSTKCPLD